MQKRQLTILSLVLVGSTLFMGCRKNRTYTKIDGFAQGTTYSITYYDSLNRNFAHGIDSILDAVDYSMSIYNDTSIITRVNKNLTDTVDVLLANVIKLSQVINEQTEDAFDITVGPVVRMLGFGPDKTKGIDSAAILKLRPLLGMDKIKLEDYKLIKSNPEIQIDVNAIAQGYTSDLVADYFKSKGLKHFLVEIGGEIVACGLNPSDEPWVIGVDKPVEGALPGEELQVKLSLTNSLGLATSGNYRKFVEVNGVKYAHTINPKTGFPVLSDLLSATVIAPTAAQADAYATAFMVKGLDWSKKFIENHPTVGAYLISSDSTGSYKVWSSPAVDKLIVE